MKIPNTFPLMAGYSFEIHQQVVFRVSLAQDEKLFYTKVLNPKDTKT
jgi:hypothetical protein